MLFTKTIYDLIKILPRGLPFGFSLQTDMVRRYMVREVSHIICFVCFGVLRPTREFFTIYGEVTIEEHQMLTYTHQSWPL